MSEEPQFDVVVTRVGEDRMAVYRVLRVRFRLSIWSAKLLMDAAPVAVEPSFLSDARRTAARLRGAGAGVELTCRPCGRAAPDEGEPLDPGPCAAAGWDWCPASTAEPQVLWWYPDSE
ncbi:ribosomal protein L7/L12 [Kitasatospora sp. NBC_00458]|uniref:ribosomal protein L7/L12 n=1 Tax=Kitasatospora sp. NBC_00458 TaxID=2903568 RepID=UPI002E177EE8